MFPRRKSHSRANEIRPRRQPSRGISSVAGPSRSSIFSTPSVEHVPASAGYRTPGLISPRQVYGNTVSPANLQQSLHLNGPVVSSSNVSHDADEVGCLDELEERTSVLEEIIMAVDMKGNGALGCAYYVCSLKALFLFEDIEMANLDILEKLVIHIQPTTVLLPIKVPEQVLEYFEKHADATEEDAPCRPYNLRTLASTDFAYESAKERLAGLSVDSIKPAQAVVRIGWNGNSATWIEGQGAGDGQHGQSLGPVRLGSYINLDSRLSVGCSNAVIGDVYRRRSVYSPSTGSDVSAFNSVEMSTLSNFMFISAEALASLQIIRPELHPNSQIWGQDKSGTGAKESLSVYGLFHLVACTPQGKRTLRQMFLRPIQSLDDIRERQRTIAVLLRPENADTLKNLSGVLRKIRDVRSTISQLQKGVDSPSGQGAIDRGVWATLSRFAQHSLYLRHQVRQLCAADGLLVVKQVINSIRPADITNVGEMIGGIIDFDQSKVTGRTAVKWGVDAELDSMKRDYDGLESFLAQAASELVERLPEWARRHLSQCIYIPQLGFLTAITINLETGQSNYEGEGIRDDEWVTNFAADGYVYYKNRRMSELDATIGDPYGRIMDREIEIIHDLAIKVMRSEATLTIASDTCGELDCLVTLAVVAEKYHWTQPIMTLSNVIQIRGGRHPLQELVVPAYVANDCYLSGGRGGDEVQAETDQGLSDLQGRDDVADAGIMVLTGPNHSGKSVYIKQVALVIYLAHMGSFVPADHATVGLTDQILTRISTRESVSRNESAFAIDLRQVAFSIRSATRRSLVVFDEFGKGTRPDDGAGLITAALDHFLSLGTDMPRVLAATHFHEIFEGNYLDGRPNLSLTHMDVLVDASAEGTGDQVTYLYKLVPGRSTSSFGSRCAALNGVDNVIVERAEAISMLLARNEDLRAACTKLSVEDEEKLEAAEEVARSFLQLAPEALQSLTGLEDSAFQGASRNVAVRSILRRILE